MDTHHRTSGIAAILKSGQEQRAALAGAASTVASAEVGRLPFQHIHSGECLEAFYKATNNGARLWLYDSYGGTN